MQSPNSIVCFRGEDGVEIRGGLLRLTRHAAVFEVPNPLVGLRISEVLADFKVLANEQPVLSGRAVLRSLIHAGNTLLCEVALSGSASAAGQAPGAVPGGVWADRFEEFVSDWQRGYRVRPEFKAVITDFQNFLEDLRLWMDRVEMELQDHPAGDLKARELAVLAELARPAVAVIDAFIEKFEAIAGGLAGDDEAAHQTYLRRRLHPLLLVSPFAYRTYTKPLGYAGDYEVVDMMLRSPYEGETLFAKLINVWLVGQVPAEAHRERVAYLVRKLVEETARVSVTGRRAQVFNLGCGPADEVCRFLRNEPVSERATLTLLDFNEETIHQLRAKLQLVKTQHRPAADFQLIRKSVQQVLKESARLDKTAGFQAYDFVYCAGLFDYLTDPVCQRLMEVFYEMLSPGGLLLATNVTDALNTNLRPYRYSMEYILDWRLIYRDGPSFRKLAPRRAPPEAVKVILNEGPGANVFVEVRKPLHN